MLSECTGETIWPLDHCRARRVPEAWIEELSDAFESSFDRDDQTIYFNDQSVNQFHGIRDVDLASKLGIALGVDVQRIAGTALDRSHLVSLIKEAVMEG